MMRAQVVRCGLVLAAALVVASTLAEANEAAEVLWHAMSGRIVFTGLLMLFCQAIFVLVYAKVLGLDGGFGSAVIAVALGAIVAIGLMFGIAVFGIFLPEFILGGTVLVLPFVAGALGVKWAFGTDVGHGLVVFLLSLSSATLVAMGYLVLVF
jgi:hypothetical protein